MYSEELKTQLAERMPGVVNAMAEAYGQQLGREIKPADLFEAMKAGDVSSETLIAFAEILSGRAREGGALEKAMKTSAAEQGRFNNAFSSFIVVMGEAGLDKGFFNLFNELGRLYRDNTALAKAFGKALIVFSQVFASVVRGGEIVVRFIADLGQKIGLTNEQMLLIGGTLLSLMIPFARWGTIIAGILMVVEDLYAWSQGYNSIFKEMFEGLDPKTQENFKSLFESMKELFGELILLAKNLAEMISNLFGGFDGDTFGFLAKEIDLLVTTLKGLLEVVNGLIVADYAKVGQGLKTMFTSQFDSDVLDSRASMGVAIGGWVGDQFKKSFNRLPMIQLYEYYKGQDERNSDVLNNWIDNKAPQSSRSSGASGAPLSGIEININGVSDPMANAYAVREVLDGWVREQSMEMVG